MKLNLGCGSLYLEGFINIDGYDDRVADMVCDFIQLPFKTGAVEWIVCHHVIEHLGYIRAIYALSECYRVLKPDGRLIIETPDIDASFNAFLGNKSVEHRASLLTWIFGYDTPGQLHRILFPKELLKHTLVNSGFSLIRFTKQKTHVYREGLRVEARASKTTIYDIISRFRYKMISENILDIHNHFLCLDFERTFIENLKKCHAQAYKSLDPILTNMICTPEASAIWLDLVQEGEAVGDDLRKLTAVNRMLCRISFPSRLFQAFHSLLENPGHDDDVYTFIVFKAMDGIKSSIGLTPEEMAETLRNLFPDKGHRTYKRFSMYHLRSEVSRLRDQGIRQMVLKNYHGAAESLRRAINSGIETLYSLINYAILHQITGRYDGALAFYRRALVQKTDHSVFDIVLEETIKCLLHSGKIKAAFMESKQFRHKDKKRFWEAAIWYHGGDQSKSRLLFKQLRAEKYTCPLMAYYLNAFKKKGAARMAPPPVRTKPLLFGEGLYHDKII